MSLPDGERIFNRTISVDIMKIDGHSVLHVVDEDTKFNAAAILRGESTKDVWGCMTRIWFHVYMGFPDVIAHDQGPQFTSEEWKGLLQLHGITSKASGVESHNALGTNERYHRFLRNVFAKIRADDPTISTELALSTAVRAVNDTAGPSGLVPTLLVYGTMPKIPINASKLPDQKSRMKAMANARKEMSTIVARDRVDRALRLRVPSASDSQISIGDEVLMFRENPIGKWMGPYVIADKKDKSIILNTGDRLLPASIDKIKHYRESIPPERNAIGNTSDILPQNLDRDAGRLDIIITNISSDYRSRDELPQPSQLMSQLDEIFGHTDSSFSSLDTISANEFVVKIVKPEDPRSREQDFVDAKRNEAHGLMSRKIWNIVSHDKILEDSLVLGGRFVLTLKNVGTPEEKAKARYIAQGYCDGDKSYVVHDISTIRASSIRLILSVSAVMGFRLFSHDVTQAYLQSKYELTRKIYVQPKEKDLDIFGLKKGELFELNKPLYGICDAGDYWGVTMDEHIVNDLHMTPMAGDAALYVKKNEVGETIGITGTYVDDSLNSRTPEFEKLSESTLKMFESKPRLYDRFDFFGAQIDTSNGAVLFLTQSYYINSLDVLPISATFADFRRARALFSWILHSRPDVAIIANLAA